MWGAPARVAPACRPVAVICTLPSPGNKLWIRPPRLSSSLVSGGAPGLRGPSPRSWVTDPTPPSDAPGTPHPPHRPHPTATPTTRRPKKAKRPSHPHQGLSFLFLLVGILEVCSLFSVLPPKINFCLDYLFLCYLNFIFYWYLILFFISFLYNFCIYCIYFMLPPLSILFHCTQT